MTSTRNTTRFTALALVAGLAACGGGESAGTAEAATADAGAGEAFTRIINVEVMPAELQPFQEIIRLTGVVRANQDVTLAAEESGVIREILVDKGSQVWKGQPLFRIDDQLIRSQVDQATAQAALAAETWERRRRLWEEDQVGSEIAYLEAKYTAEQADASLRVLQQRLERHTIKAPISGVLDSRLIEVGSMVSMGTPVARVVSLNPVKITAGVPERFAGDVTLGTQAKVTMDVFPGEVGEGTINYVGVAVDPRSRTFPVEFVMPNADGMVKPEMIASMELVRRDEQEALVVPQEALVRVETGFVLFVVDGEGDGATASVRSVELGPAQRNQVVVRSGLEVGDRVIVVGQKQVANGDRVQIVGERVALGGQG
jgi:membrane fusion protein (multidrug efflux system)